MRGAQPALADLGVAIVEPRSPCGLQVCVMPKQTAEGKVRAPSPVIAITSSSCTRRHRAAPPRRSVARM